MRIRLSGNQWCGSGVAGTVIFLVMLAAGCSVKKYIPEGELLYQGAELDVRQPHPDGNKKMIAEELNGLLYPRPNKRFLGFWPGVYFHYKAEADSGFLFRMLDRKLGEKPVFLSAVSPDNVAELIRNRLENRGYFMSEVEQKTLPEPDKKKGKVRYEVTLARPYTLKNYQLDADSIGVGGELGQAMAESPIREGQRFDLQALKLERIRLDKELKNRGYYNFNPEFTAFEADTNSSRDKTFDLYLNIARNAPAKALIPYRIQRINVYPNFQLGRDSLRSDTLRYDGKNFIRDEEYFNPVHLNPMITFQKGDLYDAEASANTGRRLGSTGAYKFVNIKYEELDSVSAGRDTGRLEANIYLSPLNQRSMQFQLQAVTKSNDFTGPSLSVIYSNRNLFHGGELLNLTLSTGYETQLSGRHFTGRNNLKIGLQGDLIFPRVLSPFRLSPHWFKYSIPKTRLNLGGEYVSRTGLFALSALNAGFGYVWDANRFVTHEINPISVTYFNLLKSSEAFGEILDRNPFLRSSFDQQFIAGLTYAYIYNGMVDARQKHQFSWRTDLDVAGNLVSLLAGASQSRPKRFLGIEYAQYAKINFDIRYHINLGHEQRLASRFYAGYGHAYGNSEVLPYSKQFYAGGPYSVRAFHTRQLGPGSYARDTEEQRTYLDQTGNIRLEANVEYRFPLISYLKGAIFADAGNVWLSRENPAVPGGEFSENWIRELGLGAGIGLRVDVQSFVIRADLAVPLHDPGAASGERWIKDYRKPVLNLAVGYPF